MDQSWTDILLLFAVVMITGGMVVGTGRSLHSKSRLLLAFSGAFLLGLCLLQLFPYVFSGSLSKPGLWIIGGFLIQIILEYLSSGVEHGHFHSHSHDGHSHFPMVVLISIGIHAFFEGMPFGGHDHGHNHSLLLGILLHKVPVALVLSGMMVAAGFSKLKSFTLLGIFAFASPAGALVYKLLAMAEVGIISELPYMANALLIGILLHVSTTIIFESSEGHRFNSAKFVTILLGLALAYFTG
ncbi:MAG: ZIP family metal transporter [Flavobacteriales bacterium]|nr:ZIP family metal transporter [Flavobacteriales bacterium]